MDRAHDLLRTFNRHIFNPIMLRVAGAPHIPFAVIRHVGRRSGKTYTTPIIVRPTATGFVIALTYGREVDWYRNLLAAGRATLRWQGRNYAITQPEPLTYKAAMPRFPPPLRVILRLNRTQYFLSVRTPVAASHG